MLCLRLAYLKFLEGGFSLNCIAVAVCGGLVSSICMLWYFDLSVISEKPIATVAERVGLTLSLHSVVPYFANFVWVEVFCYG